ncbi:ISL3 family transposase, partial [Lactiplantibacillus pentosus]
RFNPKSREYRLLKYYWRLYLKDYDSLEKRNPQWFAHLKDRMTQEQLVVAGLNLDQQFRQTYQAAHALVKSFQKRDYRSFEAALGN